MEIGKEKTRNVSVLFIKRLIVFCLIAALILPTVTGVSARAFYEDEEEIGYYVDEERNIITVYDASKFPFDKVTSETENISFYEVNISGLDLSSLSVKELEFDRCNISSIKLPEKTELLILNDSKIDYSILNKSNIVELKFVDTRFENMEKVGTLTNLDSFIFETCDIKSLKGIEKLKNNIYLLNIWSFGLEDITPLSELTSLQLLTLSSAYIKDISSLVNNPNLTFLDVSCCAEIVSLEPVTRMKKLDALYVENDQMALDEKTYNYIKKNIPTNSLADDDLSLKKQVKDVANKITNNTMTDKEKIEAVVEYTINLIEYDDSIYEDTELSMIYNANALRHAFNGKGVCKNYSALINALLREVGVICYEVRNYDHIWNLVKCGGEYYWIDATWIDTIWLEENPNADFRKSPDYMAPFNDEVYNNGHYYTIIPFAALADMNKKPSSPTVTKSGSTDKTEETAQADNSETSLFSTAVEGSDNSSSTAANDSSAVSKEQGKTDKAGLNKNTKIIIIIVSATAVSATVAAVIVIFIKKKKKSEL